MKKQDQYDQLKLEIDTIKNRHFAFTGKLRYTRQDSFVLIHILGGIPDRYINRNTNYLVLGKQLKAKGGVSNKIRLAEKKIQKGQDIKLLSEQEFYSLLKESI